MRHLLYLINPVSGTRNKTGLRELIIEQTRAAGLEFSILPSSPDGNHGYIIEHIEKNKVTDIIIAGGDGTINQTIAALRHLQRRFGIIPCGSGNGLAFAAGIPRSPQQALKLVFTGKSMHTDGFYLNDRFACMLCGLGFDAKVAHDFAQQPERGLANYVKMVVRNFFSAQTWNFQVSVKGRSFDTEAFFISVANSNQFGNNFRIAPKASLCDGLLDVVIVTRQNKLNVLLNTLKQLRGKHALQSDTMIEKDKAVIYFQTGELQISNLSSAPLHIDGDPAATATELDIKVIPACFDLITGN